MYMKNLMLKTFQLTIQLPKVSYALRLNEKNILGDLRTFGQVFNFIL